MEAALMPGRMIILTGTDKAVTVDPIIAHTGPLRPATHDLMTPTAETNRAAMDDRMTPPTNKQATVGRMTPTNKQVTVGRMTPPTNKQATASRMTTPTNKVTTVSRMTTPTVATNKAATVDPKDRTKTPRAGTDDRTTLMEVTEAATVNRTIVPPKTPRAATEDRMTPTEAIVVVMANRTTKATVDRKIPMEAAPPCAVGQTISLTEAIREAMVDQTIAITLVPTADKRNAAVVRECEPAVR